MAVQATEREMLPGYHMEVSMSEGSFAGADEFSTAIDFEGNFAIDSDEMQECKDHFVACLQKVLLETVLLRGFRINQHAHTSVELGINKKNKVSGKIRQSGARALDPGIAPLPTISTLRFEKVVRRGQPGMLEIRGCLTADDVTRDATGSVKLKEFPTGPGNILQIPVEFRDFADDLYSEWPHGELVMADDSLRYGDYSRTIHGIMHPYLGEKQKRNKFTTVPKAAQNATIRQAGAIEAEILRAIRNGGQAITDATYVAKLAQLGKDYASALLGLPLDVSANLLLRSAERKLLALNEATDLPGE